MREVKIRFTQIIVLLVGTYQFGIPYIKNLQMWNEQRIIKTIDKLLIPANRAKAQEISKWIKSTCHRVVHPNYKKFCVLFILKSGENYNLVKKYDLNFRQTKFLIKLLYTKKLLFNSRIKNILIFFINKSTEKEKVQYLKLLVKFNRMWSFSIFLRIKEDNLTISRYKEKFLTTYKLVFRDLYLFKLFYNIVPRGYKKYILIYLYSFIDNLKISNNSALFKLIQFFLKKRKSMSTDDYYIVWQIAIKSLPASRLKKYITNNILKDRLIVAYIIYYKRYDLLDDDKKKELTLPKMRLINSIAGRRELNNKIVLKSLLWLFTRQEKEGFWSCSKNNPFHNNFGLPHFAGYEDLWYDISVTGLTILAFTSVGVTHKDKNIFGKVIAKAVQWLLSNQSKNGSIDIKETPPQLISGQYKEPISRNKHGSLSVAHIYNHNISLYSLTDLYLVSGDKNLLSSILKAYKYSTTFRYSLVEIPKSLNLDDIGPAIFAVIPYILLNKKRVVKDKKTLNDIKKYISMIEEKETGQPYMYSPVPRCLGNYDSTATLLTIKGLLGVKKNKDKSVEKALKFLYPHRPVWQSFYTVPKGKPKSIAESFFNDDDIVNEFYWLFGSFAFSFYDKKHFKKWYYQLKKVLKENQRDFGLYFGCYDPEGPWARVGGRIYMTAMAILSLQVPYLFNYRIFRK
ncbi:MAG: hypothetical protein ACK4NF_01530 [Planctomycetota bacterium]